MVGNSTSCQLHFRMARGREEVEARLAGGDSRGREENGASDHSFEMEQRLPSALIATILSKLDPRSLCAASASCRYLRSCTIHTRSFMPSFHLLEIAPELDLLRPLLPPNPYLRSLKLDCSRLDYSAIGYLARSSLQELCLHNCDNFSGKLLFELGRKCPDLRSIYISSLAERWRLPVLRSELKELLTGCLHLESLSLLFDVTEFDHPEFPQLWATVSDKLTFLEIGYIPISMLTALLALAVETPQPSGALRPSVFPNLNKLCLSVDYITDVLMSSLSIGLPSLTHLDLQDAPIVEPVQSYDLTNLGLQHINQHGIMKHISLIRSQEFLLTYFRRVNDLGILLMSDTCSSLESISLGGFCRVTDTGFRAIIHACSNLRKLRVSHGSHRELTDLVFHDISATSLTLTHVSLRSCMLLSNVGIKNLSFNTDLSVLDLRDCCNIDDQALVSLIHLHKLHTLLLDGADITDVGLSFLGQGRFPLASLSLRGCKKLTKLTDACIPALFCGSVGRGIQMCDLSRIPNLSDNGILSLAKTRIPIAELRIRECPLIGDTSVMALASMQVEGGSFGSSMHLLDIYECGGITPLAIRWFKKPYFPRLRWLGINGCLNRDMVDSLSKSRPYLKIVCRGEELGNGFWDSSFGWYRHEEDELDELEQWLLEGEVDGHDEVDMMVEWE
ncbi:F-box/LRR-repeat protein 10 [Phalaenopsis equestris]|uniref:F-box/LRR-repeat protein 10 n=1 Tax=Phalaenopsis equestris TaxID=78828 RepID=UPI0009E4093E|nr:F-box/LRR-repeat protein 10 [Phalaenopsis equestris]